MNKIVGKMKFVFTDFGPILVFYVTNSFFGLKVAVLSSIVWTLAEIIFYKAKKRKISTFFKFSAGITLIFGLIDLYLQESVLFKYEAALSNAMVGVFFGSSLLGEKPIIREFAEAQGRIPKEISLDAEYYFRFLTIVWAAYSIMKAAFYVWIASNYSLEKSLIIRTTIGSVTFYGLLFISIFGAKQLMWILEKLRMLPSTRAA